MTTTRTEARRARARRAAAQSVRWAAAKLVVLASLMVALACGAMVTCEAARAAPARALQPEMAGGTPVPPGGADRPWTDEDRRAAGGILLEIQWLRLHPGAAADPAQDFNGDGAVTAADWSAWLAAFGERTEPEPEPEPEPDTGAGGAYGDGWARPAAGAKVFVPPENGRVNNRHFAGEVVRGGRFADRDIGLKLVDCTGTLFIERAVFENCRQGLAVDTTTPTKAGLTVHLIECRFLDNYRHQASPGLPAQLGMFYSSGPAPRTLGIPTLGIYGCVFVNSGLGSPDAREAFASQYHHHAYPLGNARLVVLDSLFVNASAQSHKGIGFSAEFRRNAVVGGAIGFGAGQDEGQQQRTGRHQMAATFADNAVIGLGDLPHDNQRLGWALVLQSVDAVVERNIFASPQTQNEHRPAIRLNRVRDYPVRLSMNANTVLGYRSVVESFGGGAAWTAEVSGSGNVVTPGTLTLRGRSGGLTAGTIGTTEAAGASLPSVDVAEITRKARAGEITAAEVIAEVRGQIGGTR